MLENKKPIVKIDANEGRVLSIAGGSYRIVLSGAQTNGEFAIIEMTVPPGAGANPHAHTKMLETFLVMDGAVTFKSEKGNYIAPKGTLVKIPNGGIVHGFKNHTDTNAVLICTVYPAGLDDFFIEISDFLEQNISLDEMKKKEKLEIIAEKYGNQLFPPNFFDQ